MSAYVTIVMDSLAVLNQRYRPNLLHLLMQLLCRSYPQPGTAGRNAYMRHIPV